MNSNPDTTEAKILQILGDNFEAEPAGYFNFEEATKQLKGLIVDAKIEELKILLENVDEIDTTDVERWEYNYDGLPMPIIRPKRLEYRLAALQQTRQEEVRE